MYFRAYSVPMNLIPVIMGILLTDGEKSMIASLLHSARTIQVVLDAKGSDPHPEVEE